MLTPDEFVQEFESSARTLWCIAAAVLGGRTDADDVVQEAALIAYAKRGDFETGSSFTAWMGQIVRNVARNTGRRRVRRRMEPLLDMNPPDPRPTEVARSAPIDGRGDLLASQEAFDDRVLEALGTLDETPRACLLLRIVMEMPYREISTALDIPEGTAMSHVHRARRSMLRHLEPAAVTDREGPAP